MSQLLEAVGQANGAKNGVKYRYGR